MLPKKHRLPLRTELTQVQKQGRLFQGKLFSLLVDRHGDKSPSRFGFIISTKVHKIAVKRNRARRLIIESIRIFLPQVKPGFSGVFLAKKALIDQELSVVKEEVERLFRQAKLIA